MLAKLQSAVARSRLATHVAIKIRNQCNAVLGHRYGYSRHLEDGGEQWLIDQIAPKSSFFIDVGANIGGWSTAFANAMPAPKNGLAFEPAPTTAIELRRNLSTFTGIEIVEAAVSDEEGEAVFYAEGDCGETSSFIHGHTQSGSAAITVKTSTLDTEIEARKINFIDFLKIDAEGFDLYVMRGAKRALKHHRIDILQFEYNAPWIDAGATLTQAFAFLNAFGYEVYLLRGPQLFRFDPAYAGEFFRYSVFVAVSPETRHSQLKSRIGVI
jgi:FkbM family methyltransferase